MPAGLTVGGSAEVLDFLRQRRQFAPIPVVAQCGQSRWSPDPARMRIDSEAPAMVIATTTNNAPSSWNRWGRRI